MNRPQPELYNILLINNGCRHISRPHFGKINGSNGDCARRDFFPGDDKLGFVVFSEKIKSWDPQNQDLIITAMEKKAIIDDIRQDFSSGGMPWISNRRVRCPRNRRD